MKPQFKYIVIWERMANSGIKEVEASSPEEAIELIGYPKEFCKMTAYEVVTFKKTEVGKAN